MDAPISDQHYAFAAKASFAEGAKVVVTGAGRTPPKGGKKAGEKPAPVSYVVKSTNPQADAERLLRQFAARAFRGLTGVATP